MKEYINFENISLLFAGYWGYSRRWLPPSGHQTFEFCRGSDPGMVATKYWQFFTIGIRKILTKLRTVLRPAIRLIASRFREGQLNCLKETAVNCKTFLLFSIACYTCYNQITLAWGMRSVLPLLSELTLARLLITFSPGKDQDDGDRI